MKPIRLLLTCLATALALAILAAGAALAPPVQTWFARMELLDLPGVQGSLGSLSASFGKLEVEDVRLKSGGVDLTLPSMQARLPLIKAAWHRQVLVGSIVAKGWTLDLSRLRDEEPEIAAPDSAGETPAAPDAPEKRAALAFSGILAGRRLPFDASLDGVDLEGDVLVGVAPGRAPARVHVTVTGGGMADGREGAFAIEAARVPAETDPAGDSASARCRLVVAMDSPRTVGRVELGADLSAAAGPGREELTVAASAARAPGTDDEAYSVDLSRGDRHLATVSAGFPAASRRLSGTWRVDLRDSDLAPFIPERPLPSLSATGSGQFDTDAAFGRVHALGRLAAVASGLGVAAPVLGRLGEVTVDSRFDATRSGRSVHVDRLTVFVAGDRPAATVTALQPFDLDQGTGAVKAEDPGQGWLDVSIRGFPLARLPALPGGLTFEAGDAVGEFVVSAPGEGFAVRPKGSLTASGVTVARSGRTLARDLDVSAVIVAEVGAKEWQFQGSPIAVSSAGRQLATIDAKGSRPSGPSQAMAVSGAWKADLDALASLPALAWITGRSASGEFTGSLGASSEMECKLAVVGHDPAHTATASVNADSDPGGAGELLAPVRIAFGTDVSEISVEMSWKGDKAEPHTEIKLSGENVALGHLRLIAAPLAAAGGVPLPGRSSAGGAPWSRPGARDEVPFWGDWVGRVSVAFDKLRTGDQDLTDVGGSLEIDPASIQLEGGHGELPSKNMANLEGSVAFDAAGEHPYVLSGTASGLSDLDAAILLPPQPGQDPVVEGHFTVAASVSGSGINLDDLVAGTREEFRLAGANGIIRLLRTDIADAIPEAKEPVSDTLGDAGNFVGSMLGIKGRSIDPAKNKVSKTAQSVIDFTNQVSEIGYDKISVTAVRGLDRSIRLTDLEMTSPDEHLTGSGRIAYVKGLPISEEPLSVELQLGVHDATISKLLSAAGLLSPARDGLGYSLLAQPVRFGGTLAHIDDSQWHDLLAKAATQSPPGGKKGAARGGP